MFIGHFGVGFGAKKATTEISLGTLFLAAQLLDLLWPTFVLFGWERVEIQPGNTDMTPLNFTYYPISHSLLMACLWGIVFGLVYYLIRKNRRGSVILGLLVVSHWVLDLLVHRPDLPLYPGGSIYVGFGLWNHTTLALILEGIIFIGGVWLYISATRPKNKVGSISLYAMIGLLVIIYITNLFGSPPPSVEAIGWAGELQWVFVIWAYWVDHNRVPRKKELQNISG